MPVFSLDDELIFPHPILRETDGLLAIGGDLSPERLLLAYRWGIFPWYHAGQPILWWWLAPRLMVRPHEVHISRSLRNVLLQNRYRVTMNQAFTSVMEHCAIVPRKDQQGTWITNEMIEAYTTLHKMGFAHSIEVMENGQLVGGLYGVALGKIFFGESMFAQKSNASKVGFVHLAQYLASKGFEWIDCQQDTPHMRTLGAHLIGENDFLNLLKENQKFMFQAKP